MTTVLAILIALGVPTTITTILIHRIEKRLDEEKKARRAFEEFQTKGLMATMSLCKANAIALKNGKCNGETSAALAYMEQVKREQKDFLISQGIEHIF